ncbi:MAG: hypothetical protein L0Z53_14375 [Acidobacteriales bacterium]|nr:hypothetical protein [Terriglobales bacterium]
MPLIVHVLDEDLDQWELYEHEFHRGPTYQDEQRRSRRPYHYRLKQTIYRAEIAAIKLDSPERLDRLVDQDVFCLVSMEKGYLSEKSGGRPSVRFKLNRMKEAVREPARRWRLSIEAIDTSRQPPWVKLKEWK